MHYLGDIIFISCLLIYRLKQYLSMQLTRKEKIVYLLITFYFIMLYRVTLSPYHPLSERWYPRVNWIAYRDLNYGYGKALRESLLNVVMLIPFGFLAMVWEPKSIVRQTFHGFLLSVSVEILQLFNAQRASDVTDVINNTLGALIGAILFLLIKRNWYEHTER